MDVIGIFHSQQTQKDVRKTMDVVDLCFNNFVDGWQHNVDDIVHKIKHNIVDNIFNKVQHNIVDNIVHKIKHNIVDNIFNKVQHNIVDNFVDIITLIIIILNC